MAAGAVPATPPGESLELPSPNLGGKVPAGSVRQEITGSDERSAGGAAALFERFLAAPGDPRPEPSTLVVVAHPDDEVIGAGARLLRLRSARLLHVTDGAPRNGEDARSAGALSWQDYARMRRRELVAALSLVGIGGERLISLDVADQEASHDLAALARRVGEVLAQVRPEIVLTHAYEGGHPDHDATAFAVHAACARLARRAQPPLIVEFPAYHADPAAKEGIARGRFRDRRGGRVLVLSAWERSVKGALVRCFASQRRVLAPFPLETESFRLAPRYDFTAPPHSGVLWYEHFDWGVTGDEWRRRAAGALEMLEQASGAASGVDPGFRGGDGSIPSPPRRRRSMQTQSPNVPQRLSPDVVPLTSEPRGPCSPS